MKHFYTFFVAIVLLTSATLPASAQYQQGEEPLSTITAGQKVLLQNGRNADMATAYLKWYATPSTSVADYFTDKVDDSSIMQFTDAGDGAFYLFNPANSAYIEDINYSYSLDFKLHWTTDQTKAAKFAPSEEIVAADLSTPALMFHHVAPAFDITTWYLSPANAYGRGAGYSSMLVSGYEYYNAWVVYEAVEAGGKSRLENVFQMYFSNGLTDEMWPVGDTPGCIPATILEALKQAYNEAQTVYASSTPTDEDCATAADNLIAAYNAALEAVVPLTPGYYYVHNLAVDAFAYAGPTSSTSPEANTYAYWAGYEIPETYEQDVAPYIWKVEAVEDATDFRFYSPYFEKYLTRAGSYGIATPMQPLNEQTGSFAVTYQSDGYGETGGYFNVTNTYFGGRILRAIGAGVGYAEDARDLRDDDALWQFIPVDETFVAALEAEKDAAALATEMDELVEKSNVLLAKTKVYDSDVTINGEIDTPGLINSLTTNAQEATEGDADYAIDSDVTTFFHSSWSSDSPQPEGYHNFVVTLNEPVEEFALKIVKRTNSTGLAQGSPLYPVTLNVFAINGDEADSIGTIKAHYDQGFLPFEGSTELAENMVSVSYFKLPYSAQTLRFDVTTTGSEASRYFCFSEVGVFKATYSPTASPYENIPAEVRATFLSALAAAEAEQAAGTPTRATIDALQTAYEAMDDAFADRGELRALLEEARTYETEAIETDEELGYYQSGSIDEYHAVLETLETEIEALTNPTTEQVAEMKQKIENAMAAFDAKLNKPNATMLYFIQSASAEGDNYDRYLYTNGNDETAARLTSTEVGQPTRFLNYMWRVEPQSDGTFYLRNAASGMYLGGYETTYNNVTSTYEPTPLSIVSARTPGALSIQTADGQNIFALDYQQGITLRQGTSGPDGAAFTFMEAGYEGTHTVNVSQSLQIVTLPFAVYAGVDGAKTYYFEGRTTTDDAILAQLNEYNAAAIIPAATPFVLVPEEGVEEVIYFLTEEASGINIAYELTPGTAAGLVGTLRSTTVTPPYGVMRSGRIDIALESGQHVAANSGYFDISTLEETTTEGTLQLVITDAVSAITAITSTSSVRTEAYDLQGRRVAHPVSGGIYIIGGHKVVVK